MRSKQYRLQDRFSWLIHYRPSCFLLTRLDEFLASWDPITSKSILNPSGFFRIIFVQHWNQGSPGQILFEKTQVRYNLCGDIFENQKQIRMWNRFNISFVSVETGASVETEPTTKKTKTQPESVEQVVAVPLSEFAEFGPCQKKICCVCVAFLSLRFHLSSVF